MKAVATSVERGAPAAAPAAGDLTVAPEFAVTLAGAGLRNLDDLFAYAGGERLSKARLPSWRERIRFELPGEGTFYLKRYTSPPAGVQLRRLASGCVTRSTASIEWEQMRRLEAAGVASVRWVALGEEMAGFWERRSAVLTAGLPGVSLERHIEEAPGRSPREQLRRLASFVARFHGAGYVHRDLYLCHVFFDRSDAGTPFRLIDLARVMKPRWRRRRWIVKDLASLNYSTPASVATASDRVRFLKTYLGVSRLGPGERRLARQIQRKTQQIARHDARIKASARGAS